VTDCQDVGRRRRRHVHHPTAVRCRYGWVRIGPSGPLAPLLAPDSVDPSKIATMSPVL
jgi:hypothetical protein